MPYLKSLTREVKEMWEMVLSQHQKSLTAFVQFDKDLAREILLIEERVNSCGQFVESDSEHYLSLNHSQTANIPFVLFALKTTRQLEIIGDLAAKIAKDILHTGSPYPGKLVTQTNMAETYSRSNKILGLALQAFDEADSALARIALNRIEICQEMSLDNRSLLMDHLRYYPHHASHSLSLLSVLESVRRMQELIQKLSEGIVNYNQTTAVQL